MNHEQIYIAIAVLALAVIAFLLLFIKKKKAQNGLSWPASLAFLLVAAGVIFGENRFAGYGLMGTGVLFAVIDIIVKKVRRK